MIRDNRRLLTHEERLEHLRRVKQSQTEAKLAVNGHMDEDDYGSVPPPEGFDWRPKPSAANGSFHGLRAWADNFCSLMACHPIYVDPMDSLAGRWMFMLNRMRPERWPTEFDYPHLRERQALYDIIPGIGADAHFGMDYRIGLELGWGGLLDKVRRYRGQHGAERAEFYQAEEDVIVAIQLWIRRTVDAIREMITREDRRELRSNLEEMADVNAWLVAYAPRTFREACQWIAWFNMASRTYNRDGAGGQLDELLRGYYEADLAAGRIDDEAAIFTIACLLLNDPHYYQVAGPDKDGRDQTSRVSFLILEAAHRLRSTCNLTIRVHDGLDAALFRKGVRHLLEDQLGWPRFSGDKALVEGFMRNGYSVELARQRIAVGCHWMSLPGYEYTMNDTVKISVAKVFEVAFGEMTESGARPGVTDLWERFEGHLRRAIRCTAEGIDWHLDHQYLNEPELILNLLSHGPIERGMDASHGGVEYYNMCVDGTGLATVADSFSALQQRIEREGVLTWSEIAEHLRDNYEGAEGERVRLMMRTSPRYGQGNSLGDEWARRISRRFTELVTEGPTPGGRRMIPGWFSWADTLRLGKAVGATPDGRRAGAPISHGANPNPGFCRDGAATAMARAIAAIQPGYGNTAPIQLELDPGLARSAHAVDNVCALIRGHFDLGGTLFNINLVDARKILEAHADPSKYPDLVVRVTGFSAYFAALSPEFRQLVVDRMVQEQMGRDDPGLGAGA
ncbi:MAG: formate acetyltransferase [Phycisphaerae bacterium]|nr:formate acetyltransferase [Phycisphaerae bacterium]